MSNLLYAAQKALKKLAPLSLAEGWDNVGLLIEPNQIARSAHRLLLTTDLTPQVLENRPENTGFICAYHPPIFRPVKTLTQQDGPLCQVWLECISNGIAVYSPHTAIDAANHGINDWLAQKLSASISPGDAKIISISPKSPDTLPPGHESASSGKLVQFSSPIPIGKAVEKIKEVLGLSNVMLAKATKMTQIQSIALCPGSGGSVIKSAKADLYLTGEMGHHEILAAVNEGTSVILCNHSNTERPFLREWANVLQHELRDIQKTENLEGPPFEVVFSKHDKDPLEFV